MQPCGNQCFEHERHGKCLQSLPSTFVERSFIHGLQNCALTRLRHRLACSSAQPSVKVVELEFGHSWSRRQRGRNLC